MKFIKTKEDIFKQKFCEMWKENGPHGSNKYHSISDFPYLDYSNIPEKVFAVRKVIKGVFVECSLKDFQ